VVLDKTIVPKCDPRAQRRRYGDVPWLVLHHQWVQLDEVADAIWLGCQAGWTVEEIVLSLTAAVRCPMNEALAATVAVLEFMRTNGFISYEVQT
jgi:hypothetical protein